VQHVLALHNVSAAERARRALNAGISVAYNVAVRCSALKLDLPLLPHVTST
jgi:hypothetical protein